MYLAKLELENVRSFSHHQCEFSDDINLIYGGNGIGKTTILEAIYILSISKSFRPGRRTNIIKKGQENVSIHGWIQGEEGTPIKIDYYKLKDENRIKINDVTLNKVTDLIGIFPVVVMSPEDEDIISGPAQNRRNYINRLFSIVDKNYLQNLKEFERIRKHRSLLLQIGDRQQIEIWEKPFVETGYEIWETRKKLIPEFIQLFNNLWEEVFPEMTAVIEYKSSNYDSEEEFAQKLLENRKFEFTGSRMTIGPHRDDLHFMLNSIELRNFASQGEKKIFLSVLKKAEACFIAEKRNKKPVVLLDDLFAKMDSSRSSRIVQLFRDNFQTFITTTDQNITGLFGAGSNPIHKINLAQETGCFSN